MQYTLRVVRAREAAVERPSAAIPVTTTTKAPASVTHFTDGLRFVRVLERPTPCEVCA